MNKKFLSGLLMLFTSLLACRPMIGIGWNEFLILIILIAVLLGPPLYVFIRRVESFLRRRQKDK
jgi:hypothetical protein